MSKEYENKEIKILQNPKVTFKLWFYFKSEKKYTVFINDLEIFGVQILTDIKMKRCLLCTTANMEYLNNFLGDWSNGLEDFRLKFSDFLNGKEYTTYNFNANINLLKN